MNVRELIWDDWNEEHIARHGVTPDEANEVCQDVRSLGVRIRRRPRYRVIGQTAAGRFLTVIVEAENEGILRGNGEKRYHVGAQAVTKLAKVGIEMAATRKTIKAKQSRIPRFKSRAEEAEFWDTHDTTEFEDEFTEVKIKVARPLVHILGVRLEAKTITQLGQIGRKKGLGASTLARMWLMERLDAEGAKPKRRRRTG